MSTSEQSPRHLKGATQRPDAASASAPLVAQTATRSASRPAPATPADEQRPAPQAAPVVAKTSQPTSAAEIVPAAAAIAATASTAEIITVDVRNGSAPEPRTGRATALASTHEDFTGRRRLGGRLLQQAGNLVRGERVSLAEAAGLPENVTVQAVIGGRTITKSIQL